MNKLEAQKAAETALGPIWNDTATLMGYYHPETGDALDPGDGIIERAVTLVIDNAYNDLESSSERDCHWQVIKDLNAYIIELSAVRNALFERYDYPEEA